MTAPVIFLLSRPLNFHDLFSSIDLIYASQAPYGWNEMIARSIYDLTDDSASANKGESI